MLESLRIAGVSTFSKDGESLDSLRKINFAFGSNGVGKTTISRVIADPDKHPTCAFTWRADQKLQPLVYNRDFVDRNFNQSTEVKGVFTLGEANQDIIDRIAALKLANQKLLSKISNLTTRSREKEDERAKLDKRLETKCWNLKSKHDDGFKGAFEGYRGSVTKFKDKIVQQLNNNTADLCRLEDLEKKAKTVFGETPTRKQTIPEFNLQSLEQHESNAVLGRRILGKSDVDIEVVWFVWTAF